MSLILVVDDSCDNLMVMEEFLHGLGHSCRFAVSGKLALDSLKIEKFHLIISDYHMADGDGIWLLQQLKQMPDTPKCIIVTSELLFTSEYFVNEGAAAHFSKPIQWDKLKQEINNLI